MKKRFSFLLATCLTVITLLAAMLPATVANAAIVGPIDPRSVAPGSTALLSGFPTWYQDDNGIRVELFPVNATDNLVGPPTAGNAYEVKLGFNTAFYWNATDDGTVTFPNGGTAKIVFGYEAVWDLTGAGIVGNEIVFSRIRFGLKPGVPGTYTIQHPWGTDTMDVTAVDVANNRNVQFSDDVGVVPRVFTAAITPPAARETTFLRSLSAPPGKLGDGVTAGPVTGGKLRNSVIITGPAGTITVTNFVVAGRLFPNIAPVAAFTATPATGAAPLTVNFTDTSTGPPLSWSWNFGDGSTTALSTLQNPSHIYTAPGTFTVTETVANTVGLPSTITHLVTVTAPVPAIPVASFVKDVTTGEAPLVVNFTDTTTGAPTTWQWNFGDATPVSTIQNPSHTFATAGTFTITELASNALGAAAASQTIVVTPPVPRIPVANFTMTPASGVPPLSVKFTDTTTGVPASWSWSFGDGGTSTLQSPTHVYNAAGLFAVTETATNALGTSTVSKVVTVTAPPAAPTALTATVVSATQVNLAWTDNSAAESLWMIQRATNAGFTLNLVEVHSPATTVAAPAPVTFNDLTAAAATTYFYRIIAGGTVGNSTPSNVVTVTTPAAGAPPAAVPAAPTALTATVVSATQVRLSWTDNAANETTFVVQRATDAAFTAGFLSRNAAANAVAAPSPMTFLDTAAAGSTAYFYRVLAGNGGGNSAPSNAVTVTTPAAPAAPPPPPPPPPAGGGAPPPPAPAPSGGGVGSPVPAPATNSNVNLAGLVSSSGLNADSDGKVQADAQVKTANDDLVLNVPGGTMMKDKDGARIVTIGAAITATPPAAPSGATILIGYNMGPDGAKFTPSIGVKMKFDPAKLPAGFPKSALYIATWDGAKWNKMESTVDTAANVVSALTTHFSEFAVIADPAAVPPPATTAPAPTTSAPPKTTAAPPPVPEPIEPKPAAPQGLTASISNDSQVVLHWTHDLATNEVGFMIERAEDAEFIKNMEEFHAPDLTQTFVDVTVAPGKTYFYRVMAVHGLGESDPSAVVTVTTPAPAPAATSTPPAATSTPPAATTPPATTTPAPADTSGGSSTMWIIGGIAAVVVIALVIILSVSRKRKAS